MSHQVSSFKSITVQSSTSGHSVINMIAELKPPSNINLDLIEPIEQSSDSETSKPQHNYQSAIEKTKIITRTQPTRRPYLKFHIN